MNKKIIATIFAFCLFWAGIVLIVTDQLVSAISHTTNQFDFPDWLGIILLACGVVWFVVLLTKKDK
jgi:Na+/alanine symporter